VKQKGEKMLINYEMIQKANASIQTTDIKGKDYAEVNQRIKAFRMVHTNGSILTEILSLEDGVCVMKATVMTEEGKILGIGHAYEKESSSFINKTSYIENCETSAVGRALGMCGFGIDTSVASYEEVANAIENQTPKKGSTAKAKTTKSDLDPKLLKQCDDLNIDLQKVATYYKKDVSLLTNDDLKKCIEQKQKALGGQK
jgi:hypothetical protein